MGEKPQSNMQKDAETTHLTITKTFIVLLFIEAILRGRSKAQQYIEKEKKKKLVLRCFEKSPK